ncbi:hypothetical protein ACOME3_001402 [Neoechinorhynchus agilis]
MRLVGKDLGKLLEEHEGTFSIFTTTMIAYEFIKILSKVHLRGYVHRDIKPENMATGYHQKDRFFLIDFGLAKRYDTSYSDQRTCSRLRKHGIVGTLRYASMYAMKYRELTPRDDLISLTYCLIFMYAGRLPWMGMKRHFRSKEQRNRAVREMKSAVRIKDLCTGMPKPLVDVIKSIHRLEFGKVIDYAVYLDALEHFLKEQFEYNTVLDWCQ